MKSKVWFVTGASKGLGLTLVQTLLNSGAKVAASSRNIKALIDKIGPHSDAFLPLSVDLGQEENIALAVRKTLAHFGSIDVLVNNAGYSQFGGVEEVTDAEARENFDVNVFGTLNMLRQVLPHMRERRAGHVFNISSTGGYVGDFAGVGIYCSTKFAVSGLTEGLSADLQDLGVHVTLVYPGYFRTNFLEKDSMVVPSQPIAQYESARAVVKQHADQINQQQPGDPIKAAKALMQAAEAKTPPAHLFLGPDAVAMAKAKIENIEAQLAAWKEISLSTDL